MLEVGWRDGQIIAPIYIGPRRVGSLLIHRDLRDVVERLSVLGGIMTALLAFAVLVAALVGHRMQRTIADPLLALANTARVVSETKNYSLRGVVKSNDEVGTVVRSFNDMLDRVEERNAELSQANRLKDEFLATLSHELRTPLNAILGWIRIVRSADLAPETRTRALESIERNAGLQARLIEDERRSGPPPAGCVEPAVERGQVHAAGRNHQPTALARSRLPADRVRRRHWHRSGDAAADVPAVQAARCVADAAAGRPWTWPGDRPSARRIARWHRVGTKPGRWHRSNLRSSTPLGASG
jgi:signal transduction histidine kinase